MPEAQVQTEQNEDSAVTNSLNGLTLKQKEVLENSLLIELGKGNNQLRYGTDNFMDFLGMDAPSIKKLVNFDNPQIKQDIILLILQYLQDEGYMASRMTIHDETNVKYRESEDRYFDLKRLKKFVSEGEWTEVEKLCVSKPFIKNQKNLMYTIYRQQFLELIEIHETQKRLKPLEGLEIAQHEFKDLCFLLTAKSINEAPCFADWEGIQSGRDRLVEQIRNMINIESHIDQNNSSANPGSASAAPKHVPPNRLKELLTQAAAFQIASSQYRLKTTPEVSTLIKDYTSFVLPNAQLRTFLGHTGNIKSLAFLGPEGDAIASGSSDSTIKVWETNSGLLLHNLEGHSSRIWDISANDTGNFIASASGDGTVKIWNLKYKSYCANTLKAADVHGDIYSVDYHRGYEHVVAGGYDKFSRIYDVRTGKMLKSFGGHELSVSKAIFNPLGNLVITGSKDCSVRFYDILSGICVKVLDSYLGEVSSLNLSEDGLKLLTSTKDNSNRLWDIRMLRPIRKFKGHQNTCKNFIRSNYAGEHLIVGGSEDGLVYLWDSEKGDIVQKLRGHNGIVYDCIWNRKKSLLASCSEDGSIKTWWFNPSKPLYNNSSTFISSDQATLST